MAMGSPPGSGRAVVSCINIKYTGYENNFNWPGSEAESPFGRLDPVRKIVDESVVREERNRRKVSDNGPEVVAWLGYVLLTVPRHLVYIFFGGSDPPSEK